jgi:DNA-binding NtrC family response regulator
LNSDNNNENNNSENKTGGQRRILIVDDEADVISIFQMTLEMNGLEVDSCTNPTLAL